MVLLALVAAGAFAQNAVLQQGYYYTQNKTAAEEGDQFVFIGNTGGGEYLVGLQVQNRNESLNIAILYGSVSGNTLNLTVSAINRDNVRRVFGTDILSGIQEGSRVSYEIITDTIFIASNYVYRRGNDPISSTAQPQQQQPQQQTRGTPANPIPLTALVRVQGIITSTTTELWYSLSVENRGDYIINWRDADKDASLLDVMIDVSYQNGPGIITRLDNNGSLSDNYWQFKADRNGTVLIRVYPLSAGRTGNFFIEFHRSYI